MTRRSLLWLVLLTLGLLVLSAALLLHWMTAPLGDLRAGEPRLITIPEGATFRHIAALLEQEGIIRTHWGFVLLGRVTAADRRVIPGEYALHPGMAPREILAKLISGQVVLHPVTVPEGYTLVQIAALLEDKGLAKASEFIALAHDPDFILATFHLDVPTLEGYLFPDTYHFARGTKTKDILTAMVEGFWRVFSPEWQARAQDIRMTTHQVLTLASVIEKETGAEGERELISSVFHNRLRKRIPLQSDPTVIYGLSAFDGNLRRKDLQKTTPYNTYRIAGLPPGPIANPGARSIWAALYPAATDYLYFVSKNNGTHHFSATLAEHNAAVDRYQKRPAKRVS